MKALRYPVGLITVVGTLSLLGCEHWRSQVVRPDQGTTKAAVAGPDKSTDSDARLLQSEHASGRLPGALSSEAREIESHFNVR